MSWADDTALPYAGKETVLARRERPQILLAGAAGEGSSYGTPYLLFTSAEDCSPACAHRQSTPQLDPSGIVLQLRDYL